MTEADLRDWIQQEDDEPPPGVGDIKSFSMMVAQSRGVKENA